MIAFPFNHQPDSVSIKTSSYTVPSGKYARVTVTDYSSDFTIDSVVAVEQAEFTGTSTTNSLGTLFTNNSPYILVGTMETTNNASVQVYSSSGRIQQNWYIGAPMNINASTNTAEVILKPSDRLQCTSPAPGTFYYSLSAINPPTQTEFWVTSGTDLDGSRYIVELYNELT